MSIMWWTDSANGSVNFVCWFAGLPPQVWGPESRVRTWNDGKDWFKFGSNCSSVSRGQIIPNLHIMKLGVTREIECESETQIAKWKIECSMCCCCTCTPLIAPERLSLGRKTKTWWDPALDPFQKSCRLLSLAKHDTINWPTRLGSWLKPQVFQSHFTYFQSFAHWIEAKRCALWRSLWKCLVQRSIGRCGTCCFTMYNIEEAAHPFAGLCQPCHRTDEGAAQLCLE